MTALDHLASEELVDLRDRIDRELSDRDVCEHGIVSGDWCPECNAEYKRAQLEAFPNDRP